MVDWNRTEKLTYRCVHPERNMIPIVESGPFQVSISQFEAKSSNQVEIGIDCRAEPSNVSCVGRDLWLNQDDIQTRF